LLGERPRNVQLHNRQPVDDIAELPSIYAQKRFKPIRTLWAIVASLLMQVIENYLKFVWIAFILLCKVGFCIVLFRLKQCAVMFLYCTMLLTAVN